MRNGFWSPKSKNYWSPKSSAVTHIDSSIGFWCLNEEQPIDFIGEQKCSDFESRFCCPIPTKDETNNTYVMDGTCDDPSYLWTTWMNSGNNETDGDWETIDKFARMLVCENPLGIQARATNDGNSSVVHIHKESGFWCIHEENNGECADFEVRFCCPKYRTGPFLIISSEWN